MAAFRAGVGLVAGYRACDRDRVDRYAGRAGTTSHFNIANHFDAMVFAVMGVSIACIWLGMLLLTVVLFRQPFASAWGWSLRLGMVLALVGTGSGAIDDGA